MKDPDVLHSTDDDGCPWCPHDHSAVTPCPDGEWLEADGSALSAELDRLAAAVAELPDACRPRSVACGHLRCRAACLLWPVGAVVVWPVGAVVVWFLTPLAVAALIVILWLDPALLF